MSSDIRDRRLAALCTAVLLVGLGLSLYKLHTPPGPVGDEATTTLAALSLWHDRDLAWDGRDLARAYRVWGGGPRGLALMPCGEGSRSAEQAAAGGGSGPPLCFARPAVQALAALPWVAIGGARGLLVGNLLLYLAMLLVAARALAPRRAAPGAAAAGGSPGGGSGLLLAGFFFLSGSFAYALRLEPPVLEGACLLSALALGGRLCRRSSDAPAGALAGAVAGGLSAVAFASAPPLALVALPLPLELVRRRRWPALAGLLAGALAVAGLTAAAGWWLTGHAEPWSTERTVYQSAYPGEVGGRQAGRPEAGTAAPSVAAAASLPAAAGRALAAGRDLVVGRHQGLLPYFPFALFAAALALTRPRDRFRTLLLAAAAVYCVAAVGLRPASLAGGAVFAGNRWFAAVYPALVLLIPPGAAAAPAVRRLVVLPFVAAGLWTAPMLAAALVPAAPETHPLAHVRGPTFRPLPLELALLPRLPGYRLGDWGQGVWAMPAADFFAGERRPDGVWVRGGARSEVVVASPRPLTELRFTALSPVADNRLLLASAGERLVVRFDTAGKQAGVPLTLPLAPAARDLGLLPRAPHEWLYRFTLETSGGWVPAASDPQSSDPRYLSVFLRFDRTPAADGGESPHER